MEFRKVFMAQYMQKYYALYLRKKWYTYDKYKCQFHKHILYISFLVELNHVCVFVNGLDDHI